MKYFISLFILSICIESTMAETSWTGTLRLPISPSGRIPKYGILETNGETKTIYGDVKQFDGKMVTIRGNEASGTIHATHIDEGIVIHKAQPEKEKTIEDDPNFYIDSDGLRRYTNTNGPDWYWTGCEWRQPEKAGSAYFIPRIQPQGCVTGH